MAYDLEEQEKIDQIKNWWARYGNLVTSILTILAIAYLAYQGWQWYENRQARKALGYYDIVYSVSQNPNPQQSDIQRLTEALSVLKEDFSSSAYTDRATLIAGDIFYKTKDLKASRENLEWAISNSKDKGIVSSASLNLSAIYLSEGDKNKARELLKNPAESFVPLFKDREADILMAEGQREQAFTIWKELAKNKDLNPSFIEVINMKLKVYGAE